MKKIIILLTFLMSLFANLSYASSGLNFNDINIEGKIPKKSALDLIIARRIKLQEATREKMIRLLEIQRIKAELLSAKMFENAMKKSMSKVELE
jgi:hypothetical protein